MWPCPFALPLPERPEWARPPEFEGFDDQSIPCAHGRGAECIVEGCAHPSMTHDESLCEGHWLDTK